MNKKLTPLQKLIAQRRAKAKSKPVKPVTESITFGDVTIIKDTTKKPQEPKSITTPSIPDMKDLKIVKSEVRGVTPDGTLVVDVQAQAPASVESVNVEITPTLADAISEEPAEPHDTSILPSTPTEIKVYKDTHAKADSDVLIYPKPAEESAEIPETPTAEPVGNETPAEEPATTEPIQPQGFFGADQTTRKRRGRKPRSV